MTAGERLGEQDDVGLDAPMFDCEESSGTAKSGLDFVGDEQCPIFTAQSLTAAKIEIVRKIDSLALDRFDDEGRGIARGQGFFQSGKIVKWNCGAARDEGTEALPENPIAVQRHGAIGKAMKGLMSIHNPRTPRGAAREFKRAFDGLRPGIRKENLVEKRNKTKQAFGEQTGENGHVHLHEIGKIARKDTVQCFASQR